MLNGRRYVRTKWTDKGAVHSVEFIASNGMGMVTEYYSCSIHTQGRQNKGAAARMNASAQVGLHFCLSLLYLGAG